MSNSRLEKFIYAICSMDVSDLPVPLSRIEKLWNCLITGETPDFEPLSRNEKYLMAMLDRYDISNLPAPMSRGEKLLYKIAVGETDLSDVPGYLSRYEELLKYLIENGGIGFEYVLHTLNQSLSTLYTTAEKPVKSAILKGNTLLVDELGNECEIPNSPKITMGAWIDTNTGVEKIDGVCFYTGFLKCPIVSFIVKGNNRYKRIIFYDKNKTFIRGINTNVGDNSDVTINSTNIPSNAFYLRISASSNPNNAEYTPDTKLLIEDMSGNNLYSTQLISVKMPVLTTTGKNLFDLENSKMNEESSYDITFNIYGYWAYTVKLKPNTTYTISRKNTDGYGKDVMWRINTKFNYNDATWIVASHSQNENRQQTTVTTGTDGKLYFFVNNNLEQINKLLILCGYIQIEEGSTATAYEPFKSNILTVNEDVTLRGIGDVKDELDCLTGEVTERIGEIVLDGSEDWILGTSANWNNDGDTIGFYFNFEKAKNTVFYSDKLPLDPKIPTIDSECFYINNKWSWLGIRLLKTKLTDSTVNGLKAYLRQNPITVQYQLATESIKTVDLTTVDQDGQPTRLKTFNDITYVELSSEGLIPSVDVEIATKISETLSTLGLDHHDISKTQNKLGQTIDEQTENTDATMMATTEIYEQTL